MADITVWTGQSGKQYTFEVYPLNMTFNLSACVYIYMKKVGEKWGVIYVGQTSQLATRLAQHATGNEGSDKCIQRSGATHLHVCGLTSESARFAAETDIRNSLNPSCNMQ